MILNGIDPSKILLTTFTNKAANEIKERIINVVGESGKQITVGTYHSICNKILRKYAEYIGYTKNFTILDETESDKIIKKVAEMYNVDKDLVKLFISSNKTKYEDLVNKVLTYRRDDNINSALKIENLIDLLVYRLYGLTYNEVLIVDPDTPITEEEYSNKRESNE